MKFINDVKDGISVLRIYDENYDYSYGYYAANEYVDGTHIVLARNPTDKKLDFIGSSELVLVDLINQTEKLICTAAEFGCFASDYVVHKNKVYYTSPNNNCLYVKDIFTGEYTLIYEKAGYKVSHPQITSDGKFLNVTVDPEIIYTNDPVEDDKHPFGCLVVDLENGTTETVFEIRFENPFPMASHMMICPTDKDKVFFVHEGITYYIPNRLWLWERGKGVKCLAKQKLDENGFLADCFGHECWAADGKGLYYVKYPCSSQKPTGICYVDVDGEQTDVLYSGYPYWHVCADPNGRFLAADATSYEKGEPPYSGVYLIDTKTGKEKLLVKADVTWHHPCHPHPKFNPQSTELLYHELYEGRTCVNFIKLSDVI